MSASTTEVIGFRYQHIFTHTFHTSEITYHVQRRGLPRAALGQALQTNHSDLQQWKANIVEAANLMVPFIGDDVKEKLGPDAFNDGNALLLELNEMFDARYFECERFEFFADSYSAKWQSGYHFFSR
jgi:hypothetical protein